MIYFSIMKKKKGLPPTGEGLDELTPRALLALLLKGSVWGKTGEKLKETITTHSKPSVSQQIHLHIAPASFLQALAFIPLLYSIIL